MCKFHKDVARDIATSPVNGQFDPAIYSVALVAMAKFRIEQYMPSMFGTDGYNQYALASAKGVAAFDQSGLAMGDAPRGMDVLRQAMGKNLTLAGLNLPKDPVRDVAFLDEATVELFENYTAPGYAAGDLHLKATAHKAEFEAIRAATADFLSHPGIEDILRRHFEHSMASVFTEARKNANPVLLKIYNKMPDGLRGVFKSCAMCAGSGAGGALVSHIGCFAVPVLAGATGTAVSGGVMTGMMLVGSPLIATGVTYGLDQWRGQKTSLPRLAGAAAIAFAVALGIGAMGDGHDGHATPPAPGQDHHHNHSHHAVVEPTAEALAWLNSQTPENRKIITDSAEKSGMGLGAYINDLCASKPAKPQDPHHGHHP